MSSKWILSIMIVALVGWTQVGCMMPEEGTIIYDQDFPELPADNVGGTDDGTDDGTNVDQVPCITNDVPDLDSDLLVYYDFDKDFNNQNELTDESPANGRSGGDESGWPYNLSESFSGTVTFHKNCADGMAGYYDGSKGDYYVYNNDFNDTKIPSLTGNFTITMWINGNENNSKWSSTYSSGPKKNEGALSQSNHQLDVTTNNKLRVRSFDNGDQPDLVDDDSITNGVWYYVTIVHEENDIFTLYRDGIQVKSLDSMMASWTQLRLGINRNSDVYWKGYIDEFKVYGLAFDKNDVIDKCLAYSQCKGIAPATPDNLTAVVSNVNGQANLIWNPTNGTDNYNVYWTNNPTIPIDPDDPSSYIKFITVTETSTTVNELIVGTSYDFTVTANNSFGNSEPADEANVIITESKNDSGLLVYYAFDGDLTDSVRKYNDGRYDLSLVRNAKLVYETVQVSGNQVAYFDTNEGYAFNENFNEINENLEDFTISVWIRPDQNMSKFSSVVSTGDQTNKNLGAFQIAQTSSSPNPNRIGMFAQNTDLKLEGPTMTHNTWYHVVFTKAQNGVDEGTGTFYVNGVQVEQLADFKTGFLKLKVGINRVSQNNWKGHIDELKIYNRSLSASEICNLYKNHGTLNAGATCETPNNVSR